MEKVSREDILRMVGLRDGAGLVNKVNALMLDMYDEGGKVAEYSTQILQTAKNITLLAQRVTDTESSIGELTVTANNISGRVTVIEGDYVKNADLSLYVDKESVTWLTGTADNVVFNFANTFQIQHAGTAVATLDRQGNLTILGALIQNSSAVALDITGNSSMSYISGGSTVDGIRCTSSGVQRWSTVFNDWIPLYSQRFARAIDYTYNASKTLWNDDDYVVLRGDWQKTIVMPQNPANGKVISIVNWLGTSYVKPNANQVVRVGDDTYGPSSGGKDLNDADRAELVFLAGENGADGTWLWNYMSI